MKHIAASLAGVGLLVGVASSNPPQEVEPISPVSTPDEARSHGLESLRTHVQQNGLPGPDSSELQLLVRNPQAARVLGKALFWDMAVGSDGLQSCASCHFHAGADNRTKNQMSPGLPRVVNDRQGDVLGFHNAAGASDTLFEVVGPNGELQRHDFPFVRDIGNGANVIENGAVLEPAPGNSNDTASSQGVRLTRFDGVHPGDSIDMGTPLFDPVFNDGNGTVFRRVEPRNTPTVINAVFNFHNFWDGRANNRFNGVNPFGETDPAARIWVNFQGGPQPWKVNLENSSLASQAVGPPLSDFEMSFAGREFRELGRRIIPRQALATQDVHGNDSLLANHRHPSGKGLRRSYEELIKVAFQPWLWRSKEHIYFPPAGGAPYPVLPGFTAAEDTFHLGEVNFSLFFGIAVAMYEATLVSDDTPFDRWMEDGRPRPGFGEAELRGLNLFAGKGHCINCHGGPELTNASVTHTEQGGRQLIEPMFMGDNQPGIYDNGFYNISVTPTSDDIGRGGQGPGGYPLASSRQFLFENLGIQDIPFPILGEEGLQERLERDPSDPEVLGVSEPDTGLFLPICRDLDGDGRCTPYDEAILRRVAVDGAFKTPGLRNQLLMGPYFHNGGMATLREVVEFYDRGGNFCRTNREDLDPDIQGLGLSDQEKDDLVAFLISLTDDRVVYERAPFDHPQLFVPDGHFPDGTTILREIEAVGAQGGAALQPFLEADPFGANPVAGDGGLDGDVECSPEFGE